MATKPLSKPALPHSRVDDVVHLPGMPTLQRLARGRLAYASAVAIPLVLMLVGTRSGMPAFVFEHIIVLLVVAAAVVAGIGPAVVAAIAAALGDNIFLRDPTGQPTLMGVHDLLDALLFVVVAVTVGWLVASARAEKARAEAAAAREHLAREERANLVAMVTHDLATPLGVIRGSIQLARQVGTGGSAEVERLWSRLDRAASRATSLVRTLGDAETLYGGVLALDLRPTDLRPVIASVVEMMERSSERHPLRLVMPDHAVVVSGDVERLQRVFENLVGNAIKYSPCCLHGHCELSGASSRHSGAKAALERDPDAVLGSVQLLVRRVVPDSPPSTPLDPPGSWRPRRTVVGGRSD